MKVGFIGLGNVGGNLAASLARQRFDLSIYDCDENAGVALVKQGVQWCQSLKELTTICEVIITCLPSPSVCSQTMECKDGILDNLQPGNIWMEMSTTQFEEVKRLGDLVSNKGAHAIDCPVSGGCHRAATGNISIFAGGPKNAYLKVLPLLKAMGRRILYTGDLGSASILKVITNYLASLNLLGLGEALMVAKKSGMDLAVTFEAIRASSGNSFVHETESQVILNGSHNINFTMDLALKDSTLFNQLGDQFGVPLELSPVCLSIIQDAYNRYGARSWSPQIVQRLEEACQEELRADGFPDQIVDYEPSKLGEEIIVEHRKDYPITN